MDKETIDRRNAHALLELRSRGVLKSGKFPAGTRIAMALIPGLRAPYYGSGGAYALVMGGLFALPFMLILGFVFHADPDLPAWPGVLIGLGAGAAFGGLMVWFMGNVHTRLKLTPWEHLDTAPDGTVPDGAESYEVVEGEFIHRMTRIQRSGTALK